MAVVALPTCWGSSMSWLLQAATVSAASMTVVVSSSILRPLKRHVGSVNYLLYNFSSRNLPMFIEVGYAPW